MDAGQSPGHRRHHQLRDGSGQGRRQVRLRPGQVGLFSLVASAMWNLPLQICGALEPGQVPGQLLPGVRASRPGRPAVLLPHLLLPERRGADEVPHPPGDQPQEGRCCDARTQIRQKLLRNNTNKVLSVFLLNLGRRRNEAPPRTRTRQP